MLISKENRKIEKSDIFIEGNEVSIKKSALWFGKEIGTKNIFNMKSNNKLISRCK